MATGTIKANGLVTRTFTVSDIGSSGTVQVPSSAIVAGKKVVNTQVAVTGNDNACLGFYFVYPNGNPFVKIVDWQTLATVTSGAATITLSYV